MTASRAGAALRAAAWPLAAAALATIAHARALGAFFTTDDLILFERVQGVAAWPWTAWRLLSGRLYWLAAFPLFGTRPLPWHVVNLVLHAANAALLTVWARRLGARAPAALLAGGLFGVSAGAMTVLWQAASIGELLACTLALAGLVALAGARPRGAVGAAAFAIALLAKESGALAPLAALAGAPPGARRAVLPGALAALAAGVAFAGWLALARPGTGSLGGEAYAFGFGAHVGGNLLAYAAWSADRLGVLGTAAPPGALAGAVGLALLAPMVLSAARGDARARAGLALWALALLPVLPLEHHTYVHYLYLPLAGWCVAAAGTLEALLARAAWRPHERDAAGALLALALGASLASVHHAATTRLAQLPLPADPFVRRMSVAHNAWAGLERGLPADARSLVVLRPAQSRQAFGARSGAALDAGATGPHAYDLFGGALDDGRGLRALFPRLAAVRIGEALEPGDSLAVFAAHSVTGEVKVTGRGPAGIAEIADIWVHNRMRVSAAGLLREANAIWPRDPEIGWRLDALEGRAAPSGAGAPAR